MQIHRVSNTPKGGATKETLTWIFSLALFHTGGDPEARAAEAVRHYELALEVLTREAHPLLWAQAQEGLGMAVLPVMATPIS